MDSLAHHSAAGSNAGFSFQFERALFRLAESSENFVVGIETDDDVAVRCADGSHLLEQNKHSISDNIPFSDRSKDLWKTLKIWLEAIDAGEVSTEVTDFHMVTNKLVPIEYIVQKISQAEKDEDIRTCITALEIAANEPSEAIAFFAQCVLRKDSRLNLHRLIGKCRLIDASYQSAGIKLRQETIAYLQLPSWCKNYADSIIDELLGWLHQIALLTWQEKKPCWIRRNQFVDQMHAIIDRRKRQITRERAENLIPVTTVDVGQEKGQPFVKQLHLITDDIGIVDNSIRDFIRCNIEKIRLSKEGNITDEDWKSFEATLQSRWEKIRARVIRMSQGHNKNEQDIGFEIFTDTTEAHREKLAGIDTEQVYLTAGTYHLLANMIRLGWHPKFKDLMSEPKEAYD